MDVLWAYISGLSLEAFQRCYSLVGESIALRDDVPKETRTWKITTGFTVALSGAKHLFANKPSVLLSSEPYQVQSNRLASASRIHFHLVSVTDAFSGWQHIKQFALSKAMRAFEWLWLQIKRAQDSWLTVGRATSSMRCTTGTMQASMTAEWWEGFYPQSTALNSTHTSLQNACTPVSRGPSTCPHVPILPLSRG